MILANIVLIAPDLLGQDMAAAFFFFGGFSVFALGLGGVDLLAFCSPVERVPAGVWRFATPALLAAPPLGLAALNMYGAIGQELLVPAAAVALIAVVLFAVWWLGWPRLARLRNPRVGFMMAVSALLLTALFVALHIGEQTFVQIKPDTTMLHLVFYAGTWIISALLVLPWAIRAASSDEVAARPGPLAIWTALQLGFGGGLMAIDRFYLVGLYPLAHAWLEIIALGTIAGAIRPWLTKAARPPDTPRRRVVIAGQVLLSLAAVIGASVYLVGADYMADPYFRASVIRTAVGPTLLDLKPTRKQKGKSARRLHHALLDVDLRHDYLAEANDWNVLYITIDALRSDTLPRKGSGLEKKAPHLAKLTGRCADFRRTYAPGSRTALSMGALSVGRYSTNIKWIPLVWVSRRLYDPRTTPMRRLRKMKDKRMLFTTRPEIPRRGTFPMRMKDAGFHTMATLYAGNNQNFKPGMGFEKGFVDYEDLSGTMKVKTPTSDRIAERAVRQIRKAGRKRWFQWIHFYSTHWSDGDREEYHRLLTEVDTAIGTLLKALEQDRTMARTAVFVSADHGEGMEGEGKGGHASSLDDVQTRVPMLACLPGEGGKVFDEQATSGLDAVATMLAVGRADLREIDGQNLLPFIIGGESPRPRPVFTELHRFASKYGKKTKDIKSLVRGRWKLILDRTRDTIELYDMKKDPKEARNVADVNKDVAHRLLEALEVFSHNGDAAFGLADFRRLAERIRGEAAPE